MVDLIRRRVAPAMVAGALLLGVRAVANAHATLLSAEPAAGSHLSSSPARIRLVFNEELELSLARLSLTGGDGRAVRLVTSADPHDVRAVIAAVSVLAPGSYRIDWHIVSADGHPVDGSVLFSVGSAAAQAPPPAADASGVSDEPRLSFQGAPLIPATARAVATALLMALAGVLCFIWIARRDEPQPRAMTLVRSLAVLTPMLLTANLIAWAANAAPGHTLTADDFAAALASNAGRVLVSQGALAVLAAWALLLARRATLAMIFAIAAVIVGGAIGHPAAIEPAVSIPAKAVHLVATAGWLGGLLWLLTAERGNALEFARDAARVSRVALFAVMLVAISGAVQTFVFVPSVFGLFLSAYGLVIVAKIAGLLVLVAFGAYHRYRAMPRLNRDAGSSRQLASSVRRELAVMAIVILLGGLLAYIPSPISATTDIPSHQPADTP